jgi:hypothetical protein
MEQPGLFYSLVKRDAGEVPGDVARVAAGGLAHDITRVYVPVAARAAQFRAAIAVCKGVDERVLARGWG